MTVSGRSNSMAMSTLQITYNFLLALAFSSDKVVLLYQLLRYNYVH